MSYQPHNDAPTLRDRLDRLALVREVARVAVECQPPAAFGVHGDWGAGKTSFLRQLRYHLNDSTDSGLEPPVPGTLEPAKYSGKVVTVWFEAWRYQNEPAPVVALLHEIRREFSVLAKGLKSAGKIAEVTIRSLLASLGDAAKLISLEALPFSAEKVENIGKAWEKEHLAERLPADTLSEFLRSAIETLLASADKKGEDSVQPRVIVIIDDLDRCTPEAAFRLLEGLKIYLSLPNCVFVLGMNQQAVIDAIAKQLSEKLPGGAPLLRAEAYLEKLCAHVWRLPLPHEPLTTLCSWLNDKQLKQQIELALHDPDHKGISLRCLPPNPRRLKSFANLLSRLHAQGASIESERLTRCLLLFTYVYQFHGDLFMRWQYELDFWRELRNWALGDIRTAPAEGEASKPLLHECLSQYRLLCAPGDTQPKQSYMTAFPDPCAVDVFWMGPLLIQLAMNEQDATKSRDFQDLFRLESRLAEQSQTKSEAAP